MKLTLLRAFWRVMLLLRAWPVIDRWRCMGTARALTWMPVEGPEGGYYRSGIQRQYCDLFAGHKGRCVAPIDELGRTIKGGAEFDSETSW